MIEDLLKLNNMLVEEMPEYRKQTEEFSMNELEQKRLFRSLMNVRLAIPIKEEFLKLQDKFLKDEVQRKGIVHISEAEKSSLKKQIYLWKGDITRLCVDAIVNAGNCKLLGCFIPCHKCIDNAIHSSAGVQLRNECYDIMKKQGHDEKTGDAKITSAYNLPSRFVIHTVGPIIQKELMKEDCELLKSCYEKSLNLAIENDLKHIAFCCISTGEFRFPNKEASEIAIKTVCEVLENTKSEIEVIFNVFKEEDYELYKKLLK